MVKLTLALFFFIISLCGIAQVNPIDYVNVFTGTSNSRWMISPGPALPFGMVKLGPDNQGNVWNGGYEYTNASISGFSHLHGMALSGVSYMPIVGDIYFGDEYLKLFPGNADGPFGNMWTSGYRSRIQKKTEIGSVGYYSVDLFDYNVKVELSATTRTGYMRLTYPESTESRLLLDLDFPAEEIVVIHQTYVKQISDNEIAGYIDQSNQYAQRFKVHFVSQFSQPIESILSWQYESDEGITSFYGTDWRRKCQLDTMATSFTGKEKSGVVINFNTVDERQVIVRTGISLVSEENARLNLATESRPFDWNFDAVVTNAKNTWNELLSRVEVSSSIVKNIEKFHTNFYRSFYGKNIINDVNGEYLDMCEKVRKIQPPTEYIFSSDGYWGAQWTLFPFWTLVAPEWANAFSNSFLTLGDNGGWIPEAPTGLEYAPIMGAQHHNAVIISAYQKGFSNFDAQQAYDAIKHDYSNQGIEHPCGGYAGNRHLQEYMDLGYVPDEAGPVSNTMEYAYDDWCLAQFAKALGKKKDYKHFHQRSMNYKNVFDKKTGFIRRKHSSGAWVEEFDPFRYGTEGGWNGPGYMEGNAWLYTWFVPHDLEGLIQLLGKDTYNARLQEGFEKGYVDLSNQPNLQAPFLFNYSGKPWLTQYYSRYVAENYFDLSPLRGWSGEEDEGQMGSLYCLLSMGLFEMKGGCSVEPYYDITTPVFDEIKIHFQKQEKDASTFTIKTVNNSPFNNFITSMMLNGELLKTPTILYSEMRKGGELIIHLSDEPVTK